MKKSDNKSDDSCVETREIEPSQSITETEASYYYDDSTGYEIYEDDEDEEKLEPGAEGD